MKKALKPARPLPPLNVADFPAVFFYPARAQSVRAPRACALRALGLLLADGAPTVGRGKTFGAVNQVFFRKTAGVVQMGKF